MVNKISGSENVSLDRPKEKTSTGKKEENTSECKGVI